MLSHTPNCLVLTPSHLLHSLGVLGTELLQRRWGLGKSPTQPLPGESKPVL